MREILARLARSSFSRVFLAANQYLPYGCNKKKKNVDKAWSQRNKFISGKSQNKDVANNSWSTVFLLKLTFLQVFLYERHLAIYLHVLVYLVETAFSQIIFIEYTTA